MTTKFSQFFEYKHLPLKLQGISQPFSDLAKLMDSILPPSIQKDAMMHKLLEAKDCAVRASIYVEPVFIPD